MNQIKSASARISIKRLFVGVGLLLCLTSSSLAAEWRALVIGIDAYENVSPLNGAVNDARDIAQTLGSAGVSDVTALYNADATRNAVLSAWQALVARSDPDDVLVLSYAGHGAQEEEWVAGSEADGLDEVFLLAGFDIKAPGNGERLRDDDVAAMLRAAGGRRVLVLADSCHSGSMTRSIDPRIKRLGTRLVGLPPLENDVLRSAPMHPVLAKSASGQDQPEDHQNVIYVGATVDGQVIPELIIGGEPRGALSWAFARGVEGRADLDKDGGISMPELSLFLKETVRVATEGRQTPSLSLGGETRSAVLPRVNDDILARGAQGLTLAASSQKALPVLETIATQHDNRVRLEESESASADLFWDVEEGDVLNRFGDVVLESDAKTVDSVADVVTKWLFLSDLYALAREREPIEGALRPSVGHIREGAPVQVGLTSNQSGHMAVFALEADGTIRLLAPNQAADPLGNDAKLVAGEPYTLSLKAALPFGADHIVMVRSSRPMVQLVSVLSALDGQPLGSALRDRMLQLIAKTAEGVGIASVYTQPAG